MTQEEMKRMTIELKHLKIFLKSGKVLEFSNGRSAVGDLYMMVVCDYDPEVVYVAAEALEYFTSEARH